MVSIKNRPVCINAANSGAMVTTLQYHLSTQHPVFIKTTFSMYKKLIFVTISLLFFVTTGQSQNVTSVYTQNIKGMVMDADAMRYPAASFDPERMARSGAVKKNKQPGLLPIINYRKKF
jgi:hypothetical protein